MSLFRGKVNPADFDGYFLQGELFSNPSHSTLLKLGSNTILKLKFGWIYSQV